VSPIVPVTYYQAVCDDPGCRAVADGGEYLAYNDTEGARLAAEEGDWDVEPDGSVVLCPQHARPRCDDCGGIEGVEGRPDFQTYLCGSCYDDRTEEDT